MDKASQEKIFALVARKAKALCLSTGKDIIIIAGVGTSGQGFVILYNAENSKEVPKALDRLALDKVVPASMLAQIKKRFHLAPRKHRRSRRPRHE